MGTNVSDYFRRVTGKSARAIAQELDVDSTTLNRQLTGRTTLTVEVVVAICRAFDLDLADAFVEVGFITEQEAERLGASVGLRTFTDLELAREIVRRLDNETAGEALTGELSIESNVGDYDDDVPVMSREEEQALRQADHALAAKRGRNEADVEHAE